MTGSANHLRILCELALEFMCFSILFGSLKWFSEWNELDTDEVMADCGCGGGDCVCVRLGIILFNSELKCSYSVLRVTFFFFKSISCLLISMIWLSWLCFIFRIRFSNGFESESRPDSLVCSSCRLWKGFSSGFADGNLDSLWVMDLSLEVFKIKNVHTFNGTFTIKSWFNDNRI